MRFPLLLLVERDATLRGALALALEDRFDTLEAPGLERGLELARRHKPAVVVLNSRAGGEGLWLLRGLLDIRPQPKVVVLSALYDLRQARQALDLGASAILPKPCSLARLRHCLDRLAHPEPEREEVSAG